MKTFDQLTADEKSRAVERARNMVRDLLEEGILVLDSMTEKEISGHQIKQLAMVAAEAAFYPEEGDEVIYGVAGG
jgi:hypothetical protein